LKKELFFGVLNFLLIEELQTPQEPPDTLQCLQ